MSRTRKTPTVIQKLEDWLDKGMRLPQITLLLVGVSFCSGCSKETKSATEKLLEIPSAGYTLSVEDSGSEQIDALVCQLVSQRPAPYRSGYSDPPLAVFFTNRYCTAEVEAAIQNLKKLGPAAFPALVKHLRDDRYSYSDVWAAWLNHNVGDAVVQVLDDGHYIHGGYKWRKTPSGSGGGNPSFKAYLESRGAEAWAEWAKSKSRLEIQLDFIDWCLALENERGYVDDAQRKQILDRYEAARQEVRKEYAETLSIPPNRGGRMKENLSKDSQPH